MTTEDEALIDWQKQVEDRAACKPVGRIQRGLSNGPKPVAESAWRCEGRWQCDEQMDIWQCCDEVERDAIRRHGELDDEEGADDGHDQA